MSHDRPVPDEDAARALAERIYHAVHLVPSDDSGLTQHAIWDMRQLMRNLSPSQGDLTGQEVMAIAVILAGANERKLRRGGGTPGIALPEAVPERPLLRSVV